MCLIIESLTTQRFRLRHTGVTSFWKMLAIVEHDGIRTLESPVMTEPYDIGEKISNRESVNLTDSEIGRGTIKEGIHVYLTESYALQGVRVYQFWNDVRQAEPNWKGRIMVVVRVEADIADLVAVGNNEEAVFTKITISEEEYHKALDLK